MDEIIVSALGNLPFALVLVFWIHLDYKQRASNIDNMKEIVKEFTQTIRECCSNEK